MPGRMSFGPWDPTSRPWTPMVFPGHDFQRRNADIDPGGVFSACDVVGLPSGAGGAGG